MPKSLEDAIGCWTTATEWHTLKSLAELCKDSGRGAAKATKKNDPDWLMDELLLLKERIKSLDGMTTDAINRLKAIIETNELGK